MTQTLICHHLNLLAMRLTMPDLSKSAFRSGVILTEYVIISSYISSVDLHF